MQLNQLLNQLKTHRIQGKFQGLTRFILPEKNIPVVITIKLSFTRLLATVTPDWGVANVRKHSPSRCWSTGEATPHGPPLRLGQMLDIKLLQIS
jgi:hypothetical protein